MASVIIAPEDITPFANIPADKLTRMIADALAMARLVAPCLADDGLSDDQAAAAKAIIRGAIIRWHEAGNGGFTQQQQTAGPFTLGQSFDTRQQRKGMYWPSEIASLQDICRAVENEEPSGAFSVDTAPGAGNPHYPWCSLMMGALYCSCGADLTNYSYPIYEH